VFAFAAIFMAGLFNSLNSRSLLFNLVVGGIMLLKVFLGFPFYNRKTLASLRSYLILRYAYNLFFVCPCYALLRYFTETYLPNYLYTGGILCVIEICIAGLYAPNLFRR
jgi:hypothetical protein